MNRQPEANVIIKKVDDSLSALTLIDHNTDPLEFHRTRMGFDIKSNEIPIVEDPDDTKPNNVPRSLNTLYGIGALLNANQLNRVVEVLALLRWSKD